MIVGIFSCIKFCVIFSFLAFPTNIQCCPVLLEIKDFPIFVTEEDFVYRSDIVIIYLFAITLFCLMMYSAEDEQVIHQHACAHAVV